MQRSNQTSALWYWQPLRGSEQPCFLQSAERQASVSNWVENPNVSAMSLKHDKNAWQLSSRTLQTICRHQKNRSCVLTEQKDPGAEYRRRENYIVETKRTCNGCTLELSPTRFLAFFSIITSCLAVKDKAAIQYSKTNGENESTPRYV